MKQIHTSLSTLLLFLLIGSSIRSMPSASAQAPSTPSVPPSVSYQHPVKKTIAGIDVVGNKSYEAPIVISVSGLQVGQEIEIPGEKITEAVKNYTRHGLFSEVSIEVARMEGDKVWLVIRIAERPRLSLLRINGVKKSEAEALMKNQLSSLQQGTQVTPFVVDKAKTVVTKYFDEKGFSNVFVSSRETPDPKLEGYVILDLDVDKNTKTKIYAINFQGNKNLSDVQLKKAMKKTNEGFSLSRHPWNSILEIFSTKKFVQKEYKNDLDNILSLYHEHGYRDAEIVSDTVYRHDEKRVNIDIKVNEGRKYYIKSINFVGNTKYSTDDLQRLLGMKSGDVYDQKKLEGRLTTDQDALSNIYSNNGYLFAYMFPTETEVKGDSVALDIRIHEGKPATINKVIIRGNDRLYEDVIRRELYTKPGMLFSKDYVIRSVRQIGQMGHFDPEKINPVPIPHEESGTVDIEWDLVPKSNDQIEISGGWSQTGLLGRVALKFTNFSMKNLFNPKSYKGILPQGEGQTLTLSGQTNGRYYQSYSIQFMDPWFGGKRPNMLNISAWMSRHTQINTKFYNSQMESLPYDPFMGGYGYGGYPYGGYGGYGRYGGYPYGGYGGYGGYGYGGYGYDFSSIYESAYDPDKTLDMFGGSIAYGKRLVWPDDNFQFQLGLNYTLYKLKNWSLSYYNFGMDNGISNDINVSFVLTRSSIDNPIYTRRGSSFTLNASATPPYSLFDKVDYSDPKLSVQDRNKFIEYYKVKIKGQTFLPLLDVTRYKRTPVLMTKAESGFIGSYTPYKQSPFGTFYVGGDGISGYSVNYLNETIGLRGYKNGSLAGENGIGAYAYSKVAMELRYPLIFENSTTIWVLGFLEAGNAWRRIEDYNPFHLKRSAGVGVRIMIPMIGLMGLDWGYGFDAPDGRSSKGGSNLHFVMGQEF